MSAFEYNPASIPEYTGQVMQFSSALEEIRLEAQNQLTICQESFTQAMGADAFTEAQLNINAGINEGQEVMIRQSSTVDMCHQDMIGADGCAAGGFG